MPLGMMNKVYGEAIGDQIGKCIELETEEDGSAVGVCLRVKVRLDIRKALVRGVTLISEKDGVEKDLWCPVEYEYLPYFCYRCGIIGHIEKNCDKVEERGKGARFGGFLRYLPQRKLSENSSTKSRENFSMLPWKSRGIARWSDEKRTRSDGLS